MAETEELPDEVKRLIVAELACFQTPSQVAVTVKQEYGLDVTRQRVHAYDPTKRAGANLGAELKAHFEATRAEYVDENAKVGIAQPMFRLRMLEQVLQKAMSTGNAKMVLLALEQAAKETGGAYTNLRKHAGSDGGPLETRVVVVPAKEPLETPAPRPLKKRDGGE